MYVYFQQLTVYIENIKMPTEVIPQLLSMPDMERVALKCDEVILRPRVD